MIKNIILDVGEVLLEYRWMDMLMDYGLSHSEAKRIGEELFHKPIWADGLDGGLLTIESAIEKYTFLHPDDIEVIGWFLQNGELMAVRRPEVWEKLAVFKKKGYNIYILSNYSEELFAKHTKDAGFLNIIDGGIISYQVHLLKPDIRIYKALLKKYNLKAEECMFFDDKEENVNGARRAGMNAVWVTSRAMLNMTLDEMLEKCYNKNKK